MGNGSSKPKKTGEGETPLEYMIRNFETLYAVHQYGKKLHKSKLRTLCETEWPILNPSWPPEGSMDPVIIQGVHLAVTGSPGHPDQYPYIDIWRYCVKDKSALVMLAVGHARRSAAPKLLNVLQDQPEDFLYPPPCPSYFAAVADAPAAYEPAARAPSVLSQHPQPGPMGADTPLAMGPATGGEGHDIREPNNVKMYSAAQHAMSPRLVDRGSSHKTALAPQFEKPTTRGDHGISVPKLVYSCPLRSVPGPVIDGQAGPNVLTYIPFTTTDLFNWRTHTPPPYAEKPAAMASLMESIMATHNPTWTDWQQLLLTLFSTEERSRINALAHKYLEKKGQEDQQQDAAAWAAQAYPAVDPRWDYTGADMMTLQLYRSAVLAGV
uniref:Gag protein n=1 Tax=Leptobrachium leishanense TaxID=445787 RepID=A0A8C5MJF2_9ANUR